MNRQIVVIIALLAVGFFLFSSTSIFKDMGLVSRPDTSLPTPSFSLPSLNISLDDEFVTTEAWAKFQNYLEFAKAHNLSGLRSISHQISATCNDPSREAECFVLMDNVYSIGSFFKLSEFKHVQADERQVILYTNGPMVTMLFFTRDENEVIKVLGIKFCQEDENTIGTCVETDQTKRDLDGNGWWDSVESLFYR
jgi:hypothetical protein